MKIIIVSICVFLGACAPSAAYYDNKPKIDLPNMPIVEGAGKITPIPKNLDKLDKKETNKLILALSQSELANARGYNSRGRAWKNIQKTYQGE